MNLYDRGRWCRASSQGATVADDQAHARGLGVGAMIGAASVFYFLGLRGLPVSVAAASNASVVVTVVLSAVPAPTPRPRPGSAVALTLLGATLLALSTG